MDVTPGPIHLLFRPSLRTVFLESSLPALMDAELKRTKFQRGVDLFNQREFFKCHEVLEEIWLEETEEEKPFYQGLIQVAAAFHHYRNGNLTGTLSLLRQGVEKLRRCPPDSHGLDLAALLAALNPWLDFLAAGLPTDALPLPTIRSARYANDN